MKRHINKNVIMKSKKRKLDNKIINDMNDNGYVILKKEFDIPENVRSYLISLTNKNAKYIFNHNEISKTNDRKRIQVNICAKSEYINDFMNNINTRLNIIYPHLKINNWIIISSKPGCKEQAAHTDYPPSVDMLDEQKIPINAMIALQDNTYINVWPKSHRLICNDLIDESMMNKWDVMSSEEYATYHIIDKIKIELNEGDLLLFRGDLVHSGSSYEKINYRMHCFMDYGYREPNRTWLIHKHCSDKLKRLIKTIQN
jgi:ectoine hydroxylase-related dioxygenase (phytanoyl-CoA dioxygenase family)